MQVTDTIFQIVFIRARNTSFTVLASLAREAAIVADPIIRVHVWQLARLHARGGSLVDKQVCRALDTNTVVRALKAASFAGLAFLGQRV
jgi:hypothetical protein